MAEIEIYSSMLCPFCWRAKRLLTQKGVKFEEIDVDGRPDLRRQMIERAEGRSTVPQIFIDGTPIGGSDELAELDADGGLDRMLGTAE